MRTTTTVIRGSRLNRNDIVVSLGEVAKLVKAAHDGAANRYGRTAISFEIEGAYDPSANSFKDRFAGKVVVKETSGY